MLQIFTYVTDIHHVADILTEGAAAADQVPREVPDQEHERSDGGGREVGPVSTRGDYFVLRLYMVVIARSSLHQSSPHQLALEINRPLECSMVKTSVSPFIKYHIDLNVLLHWFVEMKIFQVFKLFFVAVVRIIQFQIICNICTAVNLHIIKSHRLADCLCVNYLQLNFLC
jgi:hypothetical protein